MLGLTSVTFRDLSPAEILRLASHAGLQCVEWGGDIHVPPEDLPLARAVGDATRAAGLAVSSYGSYYFLGESPCPQADFSPILEAALALGAPLVRLWASHRSPGEADTAFFERVASELGALCDLAAAKGLSLALEYHRGTLTQTAESTLSLISRVDRPNLSTYWQPNPDLTAEENLRELRLVLPRLSNVHVFHWTRGDERCPLLQGTPDWRRYLREIPKNHTCLLEFVRGDGAGQFCEDAETLKSWREEPL